MSRRGDDSDSKPLNTHKFSLGPDYEAVERLGKGTYGSVFKIKHKKTGEILAVKKIKMDVESEGVPSTALREIAILKKMRHPNIVEVKGTALGEKAIEIGLEFMPYDLCKYSKSYLRKESFDENKQRTIKSIMFQLLVATEFLHSHKILHRDLKPGNVLVKPDENDISKVVCKLADFGLARIYSIPIRPYTKEVLTLWYRGPEMILGISNYSTGMDIWSLGCIFGELFYGKPIFQGDSEIDQLFKMFQVFGTFNETVLPGYKSYPYFNKEFPFWKGEGLENYMKKGKIMMDDKAMDLFKKMLKIDPVQRISCKEALEHVRIIF
ncbi:MAG: CDC2/CDK family serine/threonine-protein kinase [archaeon]|nr:CDC2/CDK family serine/threonine-protein kinase [archaeon]